MSNKLRDISLDKLRMYVHTKCKNISKHKVYALKHLFHFGNLNSERIFPKVGNAEKQNASKDKMMFRTLGTRSGKANVENTTETQKCVGTLGSELWKTPKKTKKTTTCFRTLGGEMWNKKSCKKTSLMDLGKAFAPLARLGFGVQGSGLKVSYCQITGNIASNNGGFV